MKIFDVLLLALYSPVIAAQTTTSATVPSLTQSAPTITAAPSTSTAIVSIWLNVTSGAPFTAIPEGVYCNTTALLLYCTSPALCNGFYHGAYYQYGSGFFASEYGEGGRNATANFESTQSCTLVSAGSSSSYFSCRGAYTTSIFPNASFVETSATTSTFTWPTAEMVSTGLAASTNLQNLTAYASCTRSAATKVVDIDNVIVLGTMLCAAVLVILL